MSVEKPLSISDYRAPLLEPFRCLGCGRRYLLWNGADRWERALREAQALDGMLVDLTVSPFSYCGCGQLLDFTSSESELAC